MGLRGNAWNRSDSAVEILAEGSEADLNAFLLEVSLGPNMARVDRVDVSIEIGDGPAIPTRKDVGLFTAWRVAFFGSIAAVLYLVIARPDPYLRIIAFVPDGIFVTFKVTLGAIALALVIGLFTGLGRLTGNRFINGIASLYVEVIRGIPLLVQLFYIYFALGRVVQIPAIASAIIEMGI